MARPKLKIDEKQVEYLASIGCTRCEIAKAVGCDEGTIRKRFSENYDKGLENGKTRLRKLQFNAAVKGNVAMLIWLGKQLLGQSDKVDNNVNTSVDWRSIKSKMELSEDESERAKHLISGLLSQSCGGSGS